MFALFNCVKYINLNHYDVLWSSQINGVSSILCMYNICIPYYKYNFEELYENDKKRRHISTDSWQRTKQKATKQKQTQFRDDKNLLTGIDKV